MIYYGVVVKTVRANFMQNVGEIANLLAEIANFEGKIASIKV